jgi:ATP-binding cassette, subfamily F, member 3
VKIGGSHGGTVVGWLCRWLEDFLRNQQLPMIIVSHDREFLDRVCTKIVDVDGGDCVTYQGNYSSFLKQKAARLETWQKAFDNQQKKIQVCP